MAEIEPIDSSGKKLASGTNIAATGQKNDTAGKTASSPLNAPPLPPKLDTYISAKGNAESGMTINSQFSDKFNAKTVINPLPPEVMNPYNDPRAKMNEGLWARLVNISDKLAAIFGEKEKDIREKLSDTFKLLEIHFYSLLEKIDASFEQKDHHKERKTRDQERNESESSSKIDNF